MGENEGSGVGRSYTTPVDDTAMEKKKRIPPKGGEMNQNGGGFHPHQWKKRKIKRQCVGCTLPRRSPRRRASGQKERKKTRWHARSTLPHQWKKRENETACEKHTALSTSGEGEPAEGKELMKTGQHARCTLPCLQKKKRDGMWDACCLVVPLHILPPLHILLFSQLLPSPIPTILDITWLGDAASLGLSGTSDVALLGSIVGVIGGQWRGVGWGVSSRCREALGGGDVALFAAFWQHRELVTWRWSGALLGAFGSHDVVSLGAGRINKLAPDWPKSGQSQGGSMVAVAAACNGGSGRQWWW